MDKEALKRQSLNAYHQWKTQWREHAKHHSRYAMKNLVNFRNTGIGRACLLVANGASFEKDIDTIKKYQDSVDIFCCDKSLGHCLSNGIKPNYVIVCDANVSYEKYLKPWEDQLQDTIMFNNVCGNAKWTDKGNWKDRYFFVNEDVISSEKGFMAISGCRNVIPAATNVSNAMIVFVTQSNNTMRQNFFGYDKIVLSGFDYSWEWDGKYYAFDDDGGGKHNYMRHVYCVAPSGKPVYTSNNLQFSCTWGLEYISAFNLPVVQTNKNSLFRPKFFGELEEQLRYNYNAGDSDKVRYLVQTRNALSGKLGKIDSELGDIARDHYYGFLATV